MTDINIIEDADAQPLPTQDFTDIVRLGWIEERLPVWLRPYAYLMRLDRPIGTWLLLLPGWWAIMAAGSGFGNFGWYEIYIFALFGFGAIIMRGAGCVINDLWDIKYDRMVERTRSRPLAAGDIKPAQAIFFLILLLWLGLIILVQLPWSAIFIGCAVMVLVVTYPLAKRITWYPQAVLGLTFNIGALMGWAAIAGEVEGPAYLLYAGGILWTLGYDTIYAHQDKTDDAIVGVRSTALKFGDKSPYWIFGFYLGAALLFYGTGFMLDVNWPFYVLWAAASFHLMWQIARWAPDHPASCLRAFRSNRNFGLILLAAFALGFLPAPQIDFSFLKF